VTSNAVRAALLVRALHAAVDRDIGSLRNIYTPDVRAWTPTLSTNSRDELIRELEHRDEAFSELELTVIPLDVGGEYACVEWTLTMCHTRRLNLADGIGLEPTGKTVHVHGVTVAEFNGDQICSLRQYWNEHALLDQLDTPSQRDE
jgi:hypothetical protein